MRKKFKTAGAALTGLSLLIGAAAHGYNSNSIKQQDPCNNMTPTECAKTFPPQQPPHHMRASENGIADEEYSIQNRDDEIAPAKTNLFEDWQADIRASDPLVIYTNFNTRDAKKFEGTDIPHTNYFIKSSQDNNLLSSVLISLALQESNIDQNANGIRPTGEQSGAIGIMQLQPAAAKDMRVDRKTISGNVEGGARYMRANLNEFGSLELALAAYHDGPTRIRRLIGEHEPTYDNIKPYISKVGQLHVCVTKGIAERIIRESGTFSLEDTLQYKDEARKECEAQGYRAI